MKAIIYGASSAGRKAYDVFSKEYEIVGFADRDDRKVGMRIEGLPVFSCDPEFLKDYLIIMGTTYKDAFEYCLQLKVPVIPYSCTQQLWKYNKIEAPQYKLTEEELKKCRVLSNRETLLRKMKKGGVYSEIGVFRGGFSKKILEICKPKKLYLIDMWDGPMDGYDGQDNYEHVQKEFAKQIECGQVELIKLDSFTAIENMEDNLLDWVYIDTCHNYEVPCKELSLVKKKMKEKGCICGHDYTNRASSNGVYYGVKEAVNEFCIKDGYFFKYITMELDGYLSYCLKKK